MLRDASLTIRRDDGVADARERDPQPLGDADRLHSLDAKAPRKEEERRHREERDAGVGKLYQLS